MPGITAWGQKASWSSAPLPLSRVPCHRHNLSTAIPTWCSFSLTRLCQLLTGSPSFSCHLSSYPHLEGCPPKAHLCSNKHKVQTTCSSLWLLQICMIIHFVLKIPLQHTFPVHWAIHLPSHFSPRLFPGHGWMSPHLSFTDQNIGHLQSPSKCNLGLCVSFSLTFFNIYHSIQVGFLSYYLLITIVAFFLLPSGRHINPTLYHIIILWAQGLLQLSFF